jgi:uncharacterized membrane protein
MTGISIGVPVLLVVFGLILLGLAHRVLDRLYLTDKMALVIVAAMAVGSFIDIPLGSRASINVGGGLIPIGLAIYVLTRAGTTKEWVRALLATAVTAGAIFAANRLIGATPETMIIDPLYVYPVIAGLVAYLAGRSRRSAFIAATMGLVLLDVGLLIWYRANAIPEAVLIGGAGAFDMIVIAGVLAVLLAELIGESRERLQGGPAETGRPRELLANLRGSSLRQKLKPVPERKPRDVMGESDYERKPSERKPRDVRDNGDSEFIEKPRSEVKQFSRADLDQEISKHRGDSIE